MAFIKGVSGNPKGRPKQTKIFTDEIVRLCTDQNLHRALIAQMAKEALKGNTKAAIFLIERIEGKATQRLEIDSSSKTLNEILEDLAQNGGIEPAPDGEITG